MGVDDPDNFYQCIVPLRSWLICSIRKASFYQILFIMRTSSLSESSLLPSPPMLTPAASKATRRVPLTLKALYTAFVCVLVPYYWQAYGPTNFLYFCDVALLITLAALWMENPLLASMPAVGILLPQAFWCIDFLSGMVGFHPIGLTEYMFNPSLSLFTRGLSLLSLLAAIRDWLAGVETRI